MISCGILLYMYYNKLDKARNYNNLFDNRKYVTSYLRHVIIEQTMLPSEVRLILLLFNGTMQWWFFCIAKTINPRWLYEYTHWIKRETPKYYSVWQSLQWPDFFILVFRSDKIMLGLQNPTIIYYHRPNTVPSLVSALG